MSEELQDNNPVNKRNSMVRIRAQETRFLSGINLASDKGEMKSVCFFQF